MVGLSVVLEAHKNSYPATATATPTAIRSTKKKLIPLVINKATMIKPPHHYNLHPTRPPTLTPPLVSPARSFHLLPPPPVADSFLDACFLCRQKLLLGKDIYMYKGDRAFCSEDCRWKQMRMDEEDDSTSVLARRKERANNNSLVSLKPIPTTASPTTRPIHQHHQRATRNPTGGGFAR